MANDLSAQQSKRSHGIALRLSVLLIFVGVLGAFFALGGNDYVNIETVKRHRDSLRAFVDAHRAAAPLIAFLLYAASTAFSLPIAILLSLTIGFLFGRWAGTLIVVGAATLGAAAAATLRVDSAGIAAGSAPVASCESGGFTFSRAVDNTGAVTAVTVGNISEACSGATLTLTVGANASGGQYASLTERSATVPGCSGGCSLTFSSLGSLQASSIGVYAVMVA